MLDPRITARAKRSALAIASITEPADPGYRGWLAVAARQVMAAQRREGTLICDAIASPFAASERYLVLRNVHVPIDRAVRTVAAAGFTDAPSRMRRCRHGRGIRLDLVVFDTWTGAVVFLEVKRGVTAIGSDHRARLRDNWAALELIGKDVAEHHFARAVTTTRILVASYYGNTGFGAERTLTRDNLDAYFDVPISESVDVHLSYFRFLVDRYVPGLTGYTGDAGDARSAMAA
jgi:hypothetical protein